MNNTEVEKKNSLLHELQKLFLKIDSPENEDADIEYIINEYNRLIIIYNELNPDDQMDELHFDFD